MEWFVYIVECGDGTLYTGVTNDLERRVSTHNAGKGAKYTRGRRPVILIASRGGMTRSEALKLECRVKRMPRGEKLKELNFN